MEKFLHAIKCDSVSAGYDGARIVWGASLNVGRGQVVGIVGKNGMGKSTLLKAIMGLLPVEDGQVAVNGVEVTGEYPYDIVKKGVGYVPQEEAIFSDLSVRENLEVARSAGGGKGENEELVKKFFPRIPERRSQPAGSLSGGEQKMLLLSRPLLTGADILLIDEVSEGLQPTMVDKVGEVISELAQSGAAILLVEQNLDLVSRVCDRVAVMENGVLGRFESLDGESDRLGKVTSMMWS